MPRGNQTENDLEVAAMRASKKYNRPTGLYLPEEGPGCGGGPVQVLLVDLSTPFEKLQKRVGGYIEIVRLGSGNLLLVDEDGLMKQRPVNELASVAADQTIVGNAIFIPKAHKRKFG